MFDDWKRWKTFWHILAKILIRITRYQNAKLVYIMSKLRYQSQRLLVTWKRVAFFFNGKKLADIYLKHHLKGFSLTQQSILSLTVNIIWNPNYKRHDLGRLSYFKLFVAFLRRNTLGPNSWNMWKCWIGENANINATLLECSVTQVSRRARRTSRLHRYRRKFCD